ncbi:GNAT family N-acetyltransferase [Micromonosporaceae bacterium Da 78-11]
MNSNAAKSVDVLFTRGGTELTEGRFRRARPADAPAMHELSRPFAEEGGLIARDLALFDNGSEDFYVVEIDGHLVACAGVRRFGEWAEIFNVAVAAGWQGRGIGRFLLASMLAVAESLGFARAFVYSKTTSEWFARHGFARVDPAVLPAERLGMVDPDRQSMPMARATVHASDGMEALPDLGDLTVHFERSGVSLPWRGTVDSLLPFAEKNGIDVDSLCWGGVCGTCSTPMKRGTVAYHFGPEVDPPGGEVLLCIARPVTDVVLDL